ncbi:hypothetical protein HMF3257_15595 [Spirosoma telluris]|uniref:Uncharacterized protein n=1 Tax=Spirosoma telluris TaxID=2183553 RepID=A0A327NJE4_9BACT|nr:hypothetical protein HMF3257_15595 [Spirosoma telluris]
MGFNSYQGGYQLYYHDEVSTTASKIHPVLKKTGKFKQVHLYRTGNALINGKKISLIKFFHGCKVQPQDEWHAHILTTT